MISTRIDLFGQDLAQLQEIARQFGQPRFRGQQIFEWLYGHGAHSFSEMTNLSHHFREALQDACHVGRPAAVRHYPSADGSVKTLFQLFDGKEVESVMMPMAHGTTLCISSQVGCAQDCAFCQTATMGFLRNLSAGEILGQVYALKEIHGFSIPFNVVFMGMGEPLLNLREVQKAFTLLTHPQGLNLGAKRITISTSGLPRQMLAIASWPKHPKLAVSLNASEDVGRTALMPINQKHNITDLLRACHQYSQQTGDPITFEYVMMKGVNDHREDAKRLIRLLGPLKCKINLIPFNANPGLPFQEPEEHTLIQFQELLNRSRIQNTIRYSKGRDVGAACGQLVASGPKDTPLQV